MAAAQKKRHPLYPLTAEDELHRMQQWALIPGPDGEEARAWLAEHYPAEHYPQDPPASLEPEPPTRHLVSVPARRDIDG